MAPAAQTCRAREQRPGARTKSLRVLLIREAAGAVVAEFAGRQGRGLPCSLPPFPPPALSMVARGNT